MEGVRTRLYRFCVGVLFLDLDLVGLSGGGVGPVIRTVNSAILYFVVRFVGLRRC